MLDPYVVFALAEKAGFPLLTDNSNKDVIISSGDDIDVTEKIAKLTNSIEKLVVEKLTREFYKKAVKVCLENAVGEDTAYKAALALDKLSRGEVKKEPTKKSIKFPTAAQMFTTQNYDWIQDGVYTNVPPPPPPNGTTGTTG